ncbi:hypothetical protein LG307_14830 [Sutcliffiella horikoshii]|uniref:hypothetical protein n=1 Tax=Sutcliffiella horikoshii TaxID=79883 RepID=UPI00384C0684
MNYIDYFDAVDVLGCLSDRLNELLNFMGDYKNELFIEGNSKRNVIKAKFQEIKTDVKKHLQLLIQDDSGYYASDFLIPSICIAYGYFSNIGTNRINPNSYEKVYIMLKKVQYHVQVYYNKLVNA